jgi:hypothetical protein
MNNNVWYNSLSEDEKTAYRTRHNAQLRQRYATDAERRLACKETGYRRYQELRQEVLAYLGSRCASPLCGWVGGCTDSRCLQIDHVRGDGAKQRREHSSEHGAAFYRKVLASVPGEEYQLLCANCNWIKRHEKHEQPQARHTDNSFVFTDHRTLREKDELGRFTAVAGGM